MKKKILFISGGGDKGYEADAKLVASLQLALGAPYEVRYPRMQTDEAEPDFGWCRQIGNEIAAIKGEVILVGHSLGASMLLKYLTENEVKKQIGGIFLISTPFWKGEEDWVQGIKLQEGFSDSLPRDVPVYLYHCYDDEEVPFAHLLLYAQKVPRATVCEIPRGGHQLDNDLTIVAGNIKKEIK
ncbi:MAG TPA: alpha/beta hydrolase [Balneolaceae bacterium]|nr:alpha/beta hydrolase [Balneolaceae bacterium]